MTFKPILLVTFLLFFLSISAYSHSQILSSWFNDNEYSMDYLDIEDELHRLIQEIEELKIPTSLIIEKLNEGASKKIKSPRLLTAIREETERLKKAALIIELTNKNILKTEDSVTLYKGISIFLLGGISEGNIQNFIVKSYQKKSGLNTFLSLGKSILNILSITDLSDNEQLLLGETMLSSRLQATGYSAISSLFLKGKQKRIPEDEIIFIVVNSLNNNEGVIRMEYEINRRGKSR